MLSERQRNIVAELTLAGRSAQHIADRFDCSILPIGSIVQFPPYDGWEKGIGKLVDGKDCQVVVVQRIPQPVMSAISEGF